MALSQTQQRNYSFPTMNGGFWHLIERKTFSFPAILQQMLPTNLLSANWHWFPPSSLCHKKKTPSTSKSYTLAPLSPTRGNFLSVARQPRQSRPPHWTGRAQSSPGLAIRAACLGAELIKPWNAPRVGCNDELELSAGFPGSCASCSTDLGWHCQGRAAQQLLQFKVAVKSFKNTAECRASQWSGCGIFITSLRAEELA